MTPSATEPAESSRVSMGWLVPPDTPSGLHIQLDGLIEAEQLSPQVVTLLGQLMTELQQAARVLANKACPKLSSCQEFTGDCSKLEFCGTYKVEVVASP